MRGEVSLDGVYYKLKQPPVQALANQMASKVGQGTSEYGDLTTWSAWIQDNWQDGIGNMRPHEGHGILYGEAETRVPNQIILRGRMVQSDTRTILSSLNDCRYSPSVFSGTFTVGSAITTTKAAIEFTTPGTLNSTTFWAHVMLKADPGTTVLFEVRNNNAGSPGATVHTSATYTQLTTFPTYEWSGVQLAYSGTLVAATSYWLCVSTVSGTFDVSYGTASYSADSKLLISGVWTAQSGKYMFYLTTAHQMVNMVGNNLGTGFFRFTAASDTLYCWGGNRLYKYSVANDSWTLVGTLIGTVNSVGSFAGTVYFADDAPLISSAATMNSAEVITNSTGVPTTTVKSFGGYLWRASSGTTLEYYNGVQTITTNEMVVGTYDRYITGIEPLGDSVAVSTNEGLYRIAPGDFAVPVMRYGSTRASNGRSMVNHDGSLYVVADQRLYRFTPDLQRQDVWLSRDDDLLTGRLGKVQSVCSANSWLIAVVDDHLTAGSKPTVWAFQDEHWHCLAVLPDSALQGADNGSINYACYYDAVTDYLFVMTPQGVTYHMYLPGVAVNPYNDTAQRYSHRSWVEWDWFDGPVRDAPKDYDSVAVIGENFGANQTAIVYWKDDASTGWELLGTVTSNYQELRWTLSGGTRPNTRRFKLGILLTTNNITTTPRIRAIRVKYHLMVKDWFRWNLIVDVSGRTGGFQEWSNDTRNTLTATQIKDNIAALCTQVPPFVYIDADLKQYEVKITDATFQYSKGESNTATSTEWLEGVWNLTLEQTTQGQYV